MFYLRGCAGSCQSLPKASRPHAPLRISRVAPGAGLNASAHYLLAPTPSEPLVASKRTVIKMELFIGALYPWLLFVVQMPEAIPLFGATSPKVNTMAAPRRNSADMLTSSVLDVHTSGEYTAESPLENINAHAIGKNSRIKLQRTSNSSRHSQLIIRFA